MAMSNDTTIQGDPRENLALPLELWVLGLGSVTDACYLPRLWLNCRRVSRAFRAATEMAFADIYLPQMKVCVELAHLLELTFDGLSHDGARACFRHQPAADDGVRPLRIPAELQRRLDQELVRLWKREHDMYLRYLEECAPSLLYTTWLMSLVEDPVFPDLEIDFSERRLSFVWKSMLSTMFGEIEYRREKARAGAIEEEGGPSEQSQLQAAAPKGVDGRSNRDYEIELEVRKQRVRNHAWARRFNAERRQEWQLKALVGYR
jgi:hypothetical protein